MLKRIRGEAKSIAVAAVTAALVAGGPAVAAQVVAFAKRAGNADKVDGIHASRKAQAGKLFPLGKNKKFPASVLPLTAGPPGPQGPPGDPSRYDNVVAVAKSGGDFASIQAALNSITDASATNRYLIWVGPGTYEEFVTTKPYVDIEGSGEGITKITHAGTSTLDGTVRVVGGVTELRFLTVENTGGSTYAPAIASFGATLRLTHVTAVGFGSANNHGIWSSNSGVLLNTVIASAIGPGTNRAIYNSSSNVVMNNVLTQTGGGSSNYGITNVATSGSYTVTVHNSRILGTTGTIQNDAEFVTHVASTLLSGGPAAALGGTLTCAGVYDENYAFSTGPTCPS